MELSVGLVLDGKITGITKFGAFVSLPGGKSGLVHISEIAHTFVNDIRDHFEVGQDVKVKLIGIDKDGKINLSIKRTIDPPVSEKRPYSNSEAKYEKRPQQGKKQEWGQRPPPLYAPKPVEGSDFEDKLKNFMQDSKNKMSSLKNFTDKRGSARPRRHK